MDDFTTFLRTLAHSSSIDQHEEVLLKILQKATQILESQTATLSHMSQVVNGFNTRLTSLEREVERLRDQVRVATTDWSAPPG